MSKRPDPPSLGALVGNRALADAVQRTWADDKPLAPWWLEPKWFKKVTKVAGAQRGESLTTIDTWLKAGSRAETWKQEKHAVVQVRDAAAHWVKKHSAVPEDKRSVEKRFPAVKRVLGAATGYLKTETPKSRKKKSSGRKRRRKRSPPSTEKGNIPMSEDDVGLELDIATGTFEAVASGSGITGDYADRGLVALTKWEDEWRDKHPGKTPDDPMSIEGGAKVNQPTFDILEGSNIVTGVLGVGGGLKKLATEDFDRWEALETGAQIEESIGQVIHGAFKLAKGIAIESGKDPTEMTQLGDIGASWADGLAAISGIVTFLKGFRDASKKSKEQGGLTTQEKLGVGLEQTQQGLSVTQSGVKTGLDITKAVTEVGATEAITALSTTAGAIGIVVGAIETVQGGIRVYQGYAKKKLIAEAEKEQIRLLAAAMDEVGKGWTATRATIKEQAWAGEDIDVADLYAQWEALKARFDQMVDIQKKYAPAFEAMRKLQSKQMESGAFKMAKGTTAVVSGALLVSGVGAPIAIGVAALGGIIALSEAGLNLARNRAASRLTMIARRLTPKGSPKGKPDAAPTYREMESRIHEAYYSHLTEVVEGSKPIGFKKADFTDIKNFVWEDKKARVSGSKKKVVESLTAVRKLDAGVAKTHWIEVQEDGTVLKEKPKKFAKVVLATAPSGHKSSQSMDASRDDIVDALFKLGTGSFDLTTKTFVNSPIRPVGDADPDLVDAIALATTNALLAAADITPKRWAAWVEKANGSEAKLKASIKAQLP